MKFCCAVVVSLLLCFSTILCPPCRAEGGVKEIFQDAFYGGLTGGLVGAAVMAFTKKPADHLKYMAVGGGIGVIGGTAYGFARSARSLAEVDSKGKVRFAMPTIMPEIRDPKPNGQVALMISAELLKGSFQ